MKRLHDLLLTIVGMMIVLASCQKAPELTLTGPASLEISADGGSGSITFTANREWSVRSSDSWVSVTPSSGSASDGTVTLSIRCFENTTYEDRSTTVTITMEELSQTVTVKQPANLGIVIPTRSYDLASDARSIEVEVQSNVQYTVSISDNWIKQTGTKGLTTNKLIFSVDENSTYDARSATITIKPQNTTVQEQVISVRQAQKDALTVEKTNFDMPYGGGEIEVKVEANISFDVTPNAEWIHYIETKALSSSTVLLRIDDNPNPDSRVGAVILSQSNGEIKKKLTIKQLPHFEVKSLNPITGAVYAKFKGELINSSEGNARDIIVFYSTTESSLSGLISSGKSIPAWKSSTQGEESSISTIVVGLQPATQYYYAFCATVYDQTIYSQVCSFTTSQSLTYKAEAIDLGLSVKWSSMNLGASSPEDFGAFFAWGEIDIKQSYSNSNYKWYNEAGRVLKYCHGQDTQNWGSSGYPDGKVTLDPEDDAAQNKLGGKWRIPTRDEIYELFRNTTHESKQINGVDGWSFTSKINGNSIFIPVASSITENQGHGNNLFWSSSIALTRNNTGSVNAWLSECHGSGYGFDGASRATGAAIRPVSDY